MTTDLIPITEIERMATIVAKSGLFGVKSMEQAAALMMVAHAEGLHPVTAAMDYDIIQGKPAKKPQAMLRDFQKAGGKVDWHEHTDERVSATFSHPAGGSVRIDWDMARAMKAGLGGKDNWKKFPRQMLRARVISEGIRAVFPGATGGMYVPEEVADFAPTEKDVTPLKEEPKPGIAGKLKAAAAKIDHETGEIERPGLELSGEVTLAEYIAQAGTLEELQGFQADVATLNAKSAAGKAARLAYNKRLAELSPQEQTA